MPTEPLRAENQRLRAQIAALEARASLDAPASTAGPPLWFDSVSDAIFIVDAAWTIQHWNQAAAQLYGWAPAEAVGRPIRALIDAVRYLNGEREEPALQTLHTTGSWRGTIVQRTRDGRELVVEGDTRMLSDAQGAISGYISINRDVTARVQAEQALQVNMERLSLAIDVAKLVAWEWDVATGTITYSTHGSSSFALPPDQTTRTIDDVIATVYPADLARYEQTIQAALQCGAPYQLRLRVVAPDGRLRWLEVRGRVRPAPAGQPQVVVGVTRDITLEQKLQATALAAQQAAAESLARLDALISSTPTGVGYLDRDLRYQVVNPALAAINHRSPEDHLGRTPQELFPGLAPHVEPIIRQVLATGEAVRDLEFQGTVGLDDGATHDWLISYFPVRDPTNCCAPEEATLRVCADGRGFDPTQVRPGSLGLGIMRERAAEIGATLTLTSAPGEGTAVTLVWRASLPVIPPPGLA